jgi:uncharacterized Zn finger protein
MSLPVFDESTIRYEATPQSFERGEDYCNRGAVRSLIQRDRMLFAEVAGSSYEPYRVRIQWQDSAIAEADCSCPYDYGGWCKHIVAALLTALRQPQRIEVRPSLEQLLNRLDLDQTRSLIHRLVARHPESIDRIEIIADRLVSVPVRTVADAYPSPIATLDPAPYRKQVWTLIREAVHFIEEDYCEEDPITGDLIELASESKKFIERFEAGNAIALLEAVTGACAENWDELEDYGIDNNEIVDCLNELWSEAILSSELAPPDKVDLQVDLESWQDEWRADFAMSLTALSQGWDSEPIQKTLKGEISPLGIWTDEAPSYADDLAQIRLRILERRQQFQEYLYLAQAEGQAEQYLTMLVRLDRVEEAMQEARREMASQEDAFALARALHCKEHDSHALAIAQQGLALPGRCLAELANWTSELAATLGQTPIALAAKITAFKASPSFAGYNQLVDLAGEDWASIQPEILDFLSSSQNWQFTEARVNIFLYEGLIDEAIAIVSTPNCYDTGLVHRVMEAAILLRPDWVIENALRRAEEIMTAGKSKYYSQAITWLKKARSAYLQSGRQQEWSAYRQKIVTAHTRKSSLMALFKTPDLA